LLTNLSWKNCSNLRRNGDGHSIRHSEFKGSWSHRCNWSCFNTTHFNVTSTPMQLIPKTLNLPHSFIHSGHFYINPSSPLLLRGAPDYSMDTVSEFHAEAHRQLQVKDFPRVPTWRLERESNPRPSG